MNVANYFRFDVINGIGIRHSLFVSGCRHRCKNCFNKQAWDFNYGVHYDKELENKILKDLQLPNIHIDGLSVLGGEPFEKENIPYVLSLIKKVKQIPNKTVWCWSGYTFEEILIDKNKKEMLYYIDVLIDGKFEEDKKDSKLLFRGSSNQRIIDVVNSLKFNKVIIKDL